MFGLLALNTMSSGSVAVRLCRSLRCYTVRSVGPELASNVQGSIAWPMASTEVNIAVFEEEPSTPVRIFMRRTLSCYARPQDRLDSVEHHRGQELCSAQLMELIVKTLAENQEDLVRMELPLCTIQSANWPSSPLQRSCRRQHPSMRSSPAMDLPSYSSHRPT